MRLPSSIELRSVPPRAVGALLLLAALVLLGFTEHTDRLRAMGEDALGGFVLTGDAAKPGPASDGQLMLATGAPQVVTPAHDPQFNVSADAPSVVRKVEMLQWKETNYGGQRNYEMEWFDHPIDSSKFIDPAAHANPGGFPIGGARFDSPDVRVGGFRLGPALVHSIQGVEAFTPDLSHLPPNMAATFQVRDGTLVSSTDSSHPQVGDLRITWMRILPDKLSVLARNHGGTLVQTNDASGSPLAQVQIGKRSLIDILTDAPQPPHFKWARRVLAILLAWIGVAMLLPPARRHDRWLALLAAIVPLALLASVYWFGVRNLAAAILLAIAIAAASAVVWRVWQQRPGPPVPPGT